MQSDFHGLIVPPPQVFMGVVDREFPEPGSADQYLEALKVQIAAAADKLKLMVGVGEGEGGTD